MSDAVPTIDYVDDVLDRLRTAAPEVLAGEPVVVAYLFGSQARGTAQTDSDVDIAVLLRPDAPRASYLDAQLRIAQNFSDATHLGNIEVVVLNDAPLPLRGRVVHDRRVVYCTDEPARVEYESLTFREFVDFQVHAEQMDREILARHAQGRR